MIANSKYMMAQNPKAQTGGLFSMEENEREEFKTLPGPITDGSKGYWHWVYIILHVASLGVTMTAALLEHTAPKADLTPADYYVEIATWMMVIVSPIAVALAVWSSTTRCNCYGAAKKSPMTFAPCIPQFILGLFLVVFAATLMLNVFVIAQGQAASSAEDKTIGFVPAALYLQCFVLATLLYNPIVALANHDDQ